MPFGAICLLALADASQLDHVDRMRAGALDDGASRLPVDRLVEDDERAGVDHLLLDRNVNLLPGSRVQFRKTLIEERVDFRIRVSDATRRGGFCPRERTRKRIDVWVV